MRHFHAPFLSLLVPAALFGCGKAGPDQSSKRHLPAQYVEGSFVVTASASTSSESLSSLTKAVGDELGCKVAEPERINWGDSASDASGAISEQLQNTFNVRYENCDFSREGTKAILSKLTEGGELLSAEAEALATASPVENDPRKGQQEHLPFIKRDKACELAEKQSKPVIVAVVDSGVDVDHPDLKDAFLRDANGEIVGANFVGARSQMPHDRQFDDTNGHGTHVAGLIGAVSNNGQGVVGVGSCANVKIMPIRVLGTNGSGSSIEIDRGIKWAADHGAQIINLSLGYTAHYNGTPSFYKSLFADLASKGVMVFAAAGNDGYVNGAESDTGDGKQWHFPSSFDHVVSVAATNSYGSLADFSNRGQRVDIAAPGQSVLATIKGGGYGRMSGTSMATPVAAGAYALALGTARAGLESSDRVDERLALQMLDEARFSGQFGTTQVASGGVLDTERLVAAMKAKFPKPSEQPTTPPPAVDEPAQPEQPSSPQPLQPEPTLPKSFAFDGLTDGSKVGSPQGLKILNPPKGTKAVYFYWGKSPYSFSKVYAKGGESEIADESKWFLYGDRTLTAVAFDANWKVIGKVSVTLKGL